MATKKKGNESKIPKCPERDPKLGDKTPAVKEWLKKYYPEEYKIKFTNWRNR